MCSTDYDPAEVWSESNPRARKQHKCGECYLPIPAGRHFYRVNYLADGSWHTFKAHAECIALARFIEESICGGGGSILTGGLGEEIGELNEYDGGYQVSERDDIVAMGIGDPESDEDDPPTARDVAEWLWDLVKSEYRPVVT